VKKTNEKGWLKGYFRSNINKQDPDTTKKLNSDELALKHIN